MKNNHGQVLILFVIFIPIIIFILGMLIEFSLISYNKVRLSSVTKSIITSCIDECEKDDIIKLYDENKVEYKNIDVTTTGGINIDIDIEVKSFLGKLINKDSYDINFNIKAFKENGKIVYKKG